MKMEAIVANKVEELFLRYGIKSVSMDDICRELTMSKKTLYQQVSSKADLVSEVVSKFMRTETEWSDQVLQSAKDPVHHLVLIAKHVSELLKRISPSTMYDLQKYYPHQWMALEDQRRDLILRQISDNLSEGIQRGIYREDLEVDLLAALYLHVATFITDQKILSKSQPKTSRLYIEFVKYHIRGIATIKGIRLLNKYEYLLND